MEKPDTEHSEKYSWLQYATHLEKKAEELSRDMLHNYMEHRRFLGLSDENKNYKKGYLDGLKEATEYSRRRIHHLFSIPYTEAYDE